MILTLLALSALADPAAPPESQRLAADDVKPRAELAGGLDVFALFQTRSSVTDLASTNPFLDGQVVGTLGGTSGVVVDPEQMALHNEQRAAAFLDWKPQLLSGKAGLSAAFEVDMAFGDRSYGVGGNTGGAFGADQVNLQTRRLHADLFPKLGNGHSQHIVVGLQFVGDSVNDPTATGPDGLLRSGGRLMFWGSEAAGVSVYGRLHDDWGDRLHYRLGAFTLYEQGLGLPDDVWLAMADLQWHPAYATTVGLHTWYVQDRAGGTAGALGTGPSSALSELQGGPRLDPYDGLAAPEGAEIHADIVWMGLDGGYNADLSAGPAGVHGVGVFNVGKLYAPVVHDDPIRGGLLDAEARWRWMPGKGSVARLEGLYSSGDTNDAQSYTGVVTGNSYGVAGAVHATHGTWLLFSDPGAINRMVSVVGDVSGGGRGVVAATASLGVDPIPDRLTTKVGGGIAGTADYSGAFGTELNASLIGEPLVFLDLGLHGAVVLPGDAAGVVDTPWAVYGTLDWLVF